MLIANCDHVIVSYDVSDLSDDMYLDFEMFFSVHTINKTKLLFDEPILPKYHFSLYPSTSDNRMINGFISKSYMLEFQQDFCEQVNYLIPMSIFKRIVDTANGVYKKCGDGLRNTINLASMNEESENAVREYHRNRLLTWLEEFN